MNNQTYVKGKGCISAKIIADSVAFNSGKRITSFEIEYNRFFLSEILMHRVFSKSSSSSRAIPVKNTIEQVRNNPAMPIYWGKNQSGMQAEEDCDNEIRYEHRIYDTLKKEDFWKYVANEVAQFAEYFSEAGYHKQIVNRILEPFQIMKTVITATEYDNFLYLRNHKDAQPEIKELARCMYECIKSSEPEILYEDEWHLPYINSYRDENNVLVYGNVKEIPLTLEQAKMISVSCCAQTSYRKNDDTYEKALKIFNKLIVSRPIHVGPTEHQATPITLDWEEGITHVDRNGKFWSGNFQGWIQFRQLIPNNACWNYEETLDKNID